jgi:hypothetical protein
VTKDVPGKYIAEGIMQCNLCGCPVQRMQDTESTPEDGLIAHCRTCHRGDVNV